MSLFNVLMLIGGIVLIFSIWKIVEFFGRHKNKNRIETQVYKKMILPSNKGRSIDVVVDNLRKSDITPEFTLDSKVK